VPLSPPSVVAPNLCPLCGNANRCALEIARETGVKQGPCWCSELDFRAELLQQVPEEAQSLACICAACARGDRRA
jgi:hypothetical protein